MQYKLALIDLTTSSLAPALRPSADFFAGLIEAHIELLNLYATATGQNPAVTFRVVCDPKDRQPDEVACHFRDNIPEAPGALAFHTVTNGIPDIELGCGLFQHLTAGFESMAVGFGHELLEMLGDPGGNGWKDNGQGILDAEEECDWVQNVTYPAANGMDLTDFLLPSFFVPGAEGPWDYKGAMTTRQDISNGYGIQATIARDASQIGGGMKLPHLPDRRMVGTLTYTQLLRKNHPYSRTSRKGLILTP